MGTAKNLLDLSVCDAARRGMLDELKRLEKKGAQLRARDDAALCIACEGGHLEVIRYLANSGAKLDARDNEPLRRACASGHLDVVRHLVGNGVSVSAPANEPLELASAAGHLEIVRYLHQGGASIADNDNAPMLRACAGGHVEVVRYLHQSGADILSHRGEPLRRAAVGRHTPVVKYLHESGAELKLLNMNARDTIAVMQNEMRDAPAIYQPSLFWKGMGDTNDRVLNWSGELEFKRTLNQNYFNFIPTDTNEPRMRRLRRLASNLGDHGRYTIEDPDCDPASWISCYPDYFIFKGADRSAQLSLYRESVALMYEYARQRDSSALLAALDEPKLGNPIRVYRDGRLISQDLINSVRERNSIVSVMGADRSADFKLAELGAGYGRLGYVMLRTTNSRYFVFDIPPALHLSQWYITTLFPERKAFRFRRFQDFAEIEKELGEADVAFFTPNQLEKFPPGYFDVFATISSLHEMGRKQIRHYMNLMTLTTRSVVYLKQQKNYINPIDDLVIGKDDYPVPKEWSFQWERFDLLNPRFFERVYRRSC